MRSNIYSPSEFFQRMKKKPALQTILDNIDTYTIEELKVIPGQPKWIREELVKLKTPERPAGYLTPDEIADMMQEKSLKRDIDD